MCDWKVCLPGGCDCRSQDDARSNIGWQEKATRSTPTGESRLASITARELLVEKPDARWILIVCVTEHESAIYAGEIATHQHRL